MSIIRMLIASMLAASAMASTAGSLVFPMELEEQRCFYEKTADAASKVYAHVVVMDGGYDLLVSVSGPWRGELDDEPNQHDGGNVIFTSDLSHSKGETKILFRSQSSGDIYRFCVKNGGIMMKSVMINLKSNDRTEQGVGPYKPMEPIKKTIIRLSESLNSIREEQAYLRTRERIHTETADATYDRVMFWSVSALVMLCSLGGAQLWYYNSLFGSSNSRGRGV
eukprot:TRINITY_DN8888_c0_g1_i1.p1 TRINITY_DN8888_c0_g1~~TRINITY_DN8888_c0_g1_i1.p1  ORF type:complete len:223 (+),score=34.28 TRINITY_DN8888_c0_g1_i1:45-713(+)